MNVPVNSLTNPATVEYLNLLNCFGFKVTNTNVTRPASNNILDHVLCSQAVQRQIINETIPTDISDHCFIVSSIMLQKQINYVELEKVIVKHQLLNDKFSSAISNLPGESAEERLRNVLQTYKKLKDDCSKKITIRAKVKGFCPWMTVDIWKWMKMKDNILLRRKRHPHDSQLKSLLDYCSKKLQNLKQRTKKEYYANLLKKSDSKSIWKCINTLTGKHEKPNNIVKLNVDDQLIKDADKIVNHFNNFFSSIGPQLASTITSSRDINRYGTLSPISNSIFLHPATEQEVILRIKDLDGNKSPGPDGIPAYFVKQHFHFFSKLITDVFNESVSSGTYPDCLKIARVTPVHKSGSKTDVNNYRPISVLPVLSKLLEQMIASRMVNFFEQNNVIYKYQYGFRSGSSTATAACELFTDIYDTINSKKQCGMLFLDLKKAFDTIDHNILLKKLDNYGIRGQCRNLIESYLAERNQFVSLNGINSNQRTLQVGVPQGSNLGPLLFLVYVNDLPNLKLKGIPRLFADDTSLLYSGTSVASIIQDMSEDMRKLHEYFSENLLSLNLAKSKYMILRENQQRQHHHEELIVNSVVLEQVQSFKYLGLTIDSALRWNDHIKLLQKELSACCGLLWKVNQFIPTKQLETIYHAFFQSRIQYLTFIWGAAAEKYLKQLQSTQNRALKAIYKRPRLYSTVCLYQEASKSILPVKALRELQSLNLIHAHLNDPRVHHNQLYERPEHNYTLRNRAQLSIPRPTMELTKKAFTYYGRVKFNALPDPIRQEPNHRNFKVTVKKYIRGKLDTYLS